MSSGQPNSMNHRNQFSRQRAMCVQLTLKEVEFHCILNKSFYQLASDLQFSLVLLGFYTSEFNSALPVKTLLFKVWNIFATAVWRATRRCMSSWLTSNPALLKLMFGVSLDRLVLPSLVQIERAACISIFTDWWSSSTIPCMLRVYPLSPSKSHLWNSEAL